MSREFNKDFIDVFQMDHILIVLSFVPETIFLLSLFHDAEMTHEECPSSEFSNSPVAPSHILIILSSDPETILLPS
jgi:hypothetical protein